MNRLGNDARSHCPTIANCFVLGSIQIHRVIGSGLLPMPINVPVSLAGSATDAAQASNAERIIVTLTSGGPVLRPLIALAP